MGLSTCSLITPNWLMRFVADVTFRRLTCRLCLQSNSTKQCLSSFLRLTLASVKRVLCRCVNTGSMTNTNLSFRGPCSPQSASLHSSATRRWGCAARARLTAGQGSRGPYSYPQTCSVSTRSRRCSSQATPSRQYEVKCIQARS